MPSKRIRTIAAALALIAALGLCAAPANARPWGLSGPERIEAGVLAQVWRWLTGIWAPAPAGTMERMHGQSTTTLGTSGGSDQLNRGGTYDPNGAR